MSDYNHDVRGRQFPKAMGGCFFFGVVANRRLNISKNTSFLSITSFSKVKALSVKLLSAERINSRLYCFQWVYAYNRKEGIR